MHICELLCEAKTTANNEKCKMVHSPQMLLSACLIPQAMLLYLAEQSKQNLKYLE